MFLLHGLGSPLILYQIILQSLSKNQRAALAEITDVLRAVCYAHRLPLALTWIPSSYTVGQGEGSMKTHSRGCKRNLNEKYVLCIEDSACYVNDKEMKGFIHACSEHYLEEGQGIAGKALQSNHPFFYPDVKEYHISEYPLVQHARKFGLNAAVAIRLRSTYTGDNDYILEFFLPVNMKGSTEQQLLLNNLSSTMQRICKSLRTVSDTELHKMVNPKTELQGVEMRNTPPISFSPRSSEESFLGGNIKTVDSITPDVIESTSFRKEAGGPHEQVIVILSFSIWYPCDKFCFLWYKCSHWFSLICNIQVSILLNVHSYYIFCKRKIEGKKCCSH